MQVGIAGYHLTQEQYPHLKSSPLKPTANLTAIAANRSRIVGSVRQDTHRFSVPRAKVRAWNTMMTRAMRREFGMVTREGIQGIRERFADLLTMKFMSFISIVFPVRHTEA